MASATDHGSQDLGHPSPEGRALRVDLAVVGAGFSGLATLANLLESWGGAPLRVAWLERSGRFGPGVAYGARSHLRLLNVRASGMSAQAQEPEHFIEFARFYSDASEQPCGQDFLPRALYGRYLEAWLDRCERAAAHSAQVLRLRAEAVRLRAPDGQSPACLELADGGRVHAGRVVLALGNAAPARPAWLADLGPAGDPRVLTNPWDEAALAAVRPGERVLVLGTGLTAIDSILDLAPRLAGGHILALSRRGLIPRVHRDLRGLPETPALVLEPEEQRSVLALLRGLRRRIREQQQRGGDWRQVVDSLRAHTPQLWAGLPLEQRARFVHRLAAFWDVHRHRLPGPAWSALGAHLHSGRVRFLAGRVRSFKARSAGLEFAIQARGSKRSETVVFDRLLLANGPESDPARAHGSLLSGAIAGGLVRPDPLGLGLESTHDGRALDGAGRPQAWLDLIGSLRRPSLWESTAVPELRVQAKQLAERLRLQLDPPRPVLTHQR